MAGMSAEVHIKARLGDADSIVDLLPWKLGTTEAQRKRARGRVAALAHPSPRCCQRVGARRGECRPGQRARCRGGTGRRRAGEAVARGAQARQERAPCGERAGPAGDDELAYEFGQGAMT
jgi:hypothetical protein